MKVRVVVDVFSLAFGGKLMINDRNEGVDHDLERSWMRVEARCIS